MAAVELDRPLYYMEIGHIVSVANKPRKFAMNEFLLPFFGKLIDEAAADICMDKKQIIISNKSTISCFLQYAMKDK